MNVLNKRTRGSKYVGSSGSIPAQPKIQKKKRTHVRKMKESHYVLQEDPEIEANTNLVTRMVRNKKAFADASLLDKALVIASEIEVPAETLLKELTTEDAQKVFKLAEDIQDLVAEETDELLKEVQREEGTSGFAALEDTRGNSPSLNISDNLTDLDTSSPSSSSETSSTPSP